MGAPKEHQYLLLPFVHDKLLWFCSGITQFAHGYWNFAKLGRLTVKPAHMIPHYRHTVRARYKCLAVTIDSVLGAYCYHRYRSRPAKISEFEKKRQTLPNSYADALGKLQCRDTLDSLVGRLWNRGFASLNPEFPTPSPVTLIFIRYLNCPTSLLTNVSCIRNPPRTVNSRNQAAALPKFRSFELRTSSAAVLRFLRFLSPRVRLHWKIRSNFCTGFLKRKHSIREYPWQRFQRIASWDCIFEFLSGIRIYIAPWPTHLVKGNERRVEV